MRVIFVFLLFIYTNASAQILVDTLQSFVKIKSKNSDSYFITFEIQRGYPDLLDFVNTGKLGKVDVFIDAFIFEVKDFPISSWRIVKGSSEQAKDIDKEDLVMLSNRNENFSGNLNFKEMFRNITNFNTDGILPGISMAILKSGDTVYRRIELLHSNKFRIGVWRAGTYVTNYEFYSDDITTSEELKLRGQPKNLNCAYNLQTLQYKLYEWIKKNSIDRKNEYTFL